MNTLKYYSIIAFLLMAVASYVGCKEYKKRTKIEAIKRVIKLSEDDFEDRMSRSRQKSNEALKNFANDSTPVGLLLYESDYYLDEAQKIQEYVKKQQLLLKKVENE